MWTIQIASDIEVVGYDPEMADMDRPRGELLGEVFYLRATNEKGYRKVFGSYTNAAEAEAAIKTAPPVYRWVDSRPEYGSFAYENGGEAAQRHSERRQEEAARMGFDTRYSRY